MVPVEVFVANEIIEGNTRSWLQELSIVAHCPISSVGTEMNFPRQYVFGRSEIFVDNRVIHVLSIFPISTEHRLLQ